MYVCVCVCVYIYIYINIYIYIYIYFYSRGHPERLAAATQGTLDAKGRLLMPPHDILPRGTVARIV